MRITTERRSMARLGNKRAVATAAGVDFGAVTGALLRISCVRRFGCGTDQRFDAERLDSALSGSWIDPLLVFCDNRGASFGSPEPVNSLVGK